jgi:DNA repair protein RadC
LKMVTEIIEKQFKASEVDLVYRTRIPQSELIKITCSKESFELLKRFYDPDKLEHIETSYVVLLNKAGRVLGVKKLGEGGIDHCIIDPRIVFQTALLSNATGIILSHNHPSGNRKISEADRKITKQIKEAGELLSISVLDHIIITEQDKYVSFADEGEL